MKKVLQSIACLLLLVGCKAITTTNYLCFDEVKYITQFPQTIQLDPGEPVELDLIGIQDMLIHDSLMIVGTSNSRGYWSFFSLPDFEHKGDFLLQGNGPQEFRYPPSAGKAQFRAEDGKTVIYISDTNKGRIMCMDLSETLRAKELRIVNVRDSLPPLLFDLVYIDSTTYLCKTITKDQAQQTRFLIKDGRREKPEFLKKLNDTRVTPHDLNYNLLSTGIKYSPEHNMVIEALSGLNSLNMYTPDGSFAQTLCLGEALFNLDELETKSFWKRPYTHIGLRFFDTFWGVLHLDETHNTFQTKRKNLPKIYLFDWQGEPKAELLLPRQATSFDIDLKNGYLYTIDHITEEIYRYEFKDIVD